MDYIGWTIGVASFGFAIWTEYNSRKQRERLHSFLKGIKTGIDEGDTRTIKAIDDEMATLIPPKKIKK